MDGSTWRKKWWLQYIDRKLTHCSIAWINDLFDLTLRTNDWDGWVEKIVPKANMTSIRENLVFKVISIVQDEGLKNLYLHKYLVDCEELHVYLILKVIEQYNNMACITQNTQNALKTHFVKSVHILWDTEEINSTLDKLKRIMFRQPGRSVASAGAHTPAPEVNAPSPRRVPHQHIVPQHECTVFVNQ